MLTQLRHLLAIVEHGTFTEASRRVHLSQPALTASIHRLEEAIGARLLHRGRRGAELTAAGEAFLPRAQAAIAAIEEGRRAVAEVEGVRAGDVRIGAGATVCSYMLPRIIARFRRRYPNVRIMLREAFRDRIENLVRTGDLDLGIVVGPGDELWSRDELIVVASPKIDPKRAGFVTFPEGSSTRAMLHRHFGDVDVVMELSGIAAVKSNVRAGVGQALISRTAVEADLATGRLVEVRSRKTPIKRKLSIVYRSVERLPPAAAALRTLLLAAR